MATTTIEAIFNQMETVILALTPAKKSALKFQRGPRDKVLRQWATEKAKGSAISRKWQLVRDGDAEDPEFLAPDQVDRTEHVTLIVAYYAPSFRGAQGDDDTEDIMRADARQLRDALFSSGNYVSGQSAAFVTIMAPEREDENIWFQEMAIELRYFEAQSLV